MIEYCTLEVDDGFSFEEFDDDRTSLTGFHEIDEPEEEVEYQPQKLKINIDKYWEHIENLIDLVSVLNQHVGFRMQSNFGQSKYFDGSIDRLDAAIRADNAKISEEKKNIANICGKTVPEDICNIIKKNNYYFRRKAENKRSRGEYVSPGEFFIKS